MTKSKNTHAWRLCPPGEHWRRTHHLRIPPSKKNPAGDVTTRHGHCVLNPTGKDQLYPDEIQEMAEQNFSKVKEKPCPIDLGFKNQGDQYDDLIVGWTKYWNDILKPETMLTPNIVKALIASESGFDPKILANKKNKNNACDILLGFLSYAVVAPPSVRSAASVSSERLSITENPRRNMSQDFRRGVLANCAETNLWT